MFGLLNSSQIYGLQQIHEHNNIKTTYSNTRANNKQRRYSSSASDTTSKESKFFASLSSMQGMKSPTNFIEKFIKTELLNGYDSLKNYKNFQNSSTASSTGHNPASCKQASGGFNTNPEGILNSFNCLQGSYRSNFDGEFYEAVNVSNRKPATKSPEMTIKCSKNLLVEPPQVQAPATLQNYQKLPEAEHDLMQTESVLAPSSGASSGEFNSDANVGNTAASGSLYKRFSFGARGGKNLDSAPVQTNEIASDNSSSSISTTTTNSSTNTTSLSAKSNDLQRTSSASSSGDCTASRDRKKALLLPLRNVAEPSKDSTTTSSTITSSSNTLPLERSQRRKLMQMISAYDQQNKLLQRELAKEKRRRTEELSCVVKSLLCFESKLKNDMKTVNQRMLEKDGEICRLVRQNCALRKQMAKLQKLQQESICDEGVVEDDGPESLEESDKELQEDCLVLEALQCTSCRKKFYDIDLKESWTQTTTLKDGSRNNDDHTTEVGSSSDDTVSSSFYGARRSVRYTSKRTSGTFRDYMRSRAMNIDDPALDNNSEGTTSTISRDDSQTSYEKLNVYSRTIERMHGVKNGLESGRESEQSGMEAVARSGSRLSNKSSSSRSSSRAASEKSERSAKSKEVEVDDGIFSPTQDDDFEEEMALVKKVNDRNLQIVQRRSMEFSEASPKQVYETSTDDWYASASDQEEIGGSAASKSYGHGAVNPVLECVNQILLQQSMEESHESNHALETSSAGEQQPLTKKLPTNHLQVTTANLPRRSSLSGRRTVNSNSHANEGQTSRSGTLTRKRVHFSTKNSMVHVPRNDDDDDDEDNVISINNQQQTQYNPTNYFPATPTASAPSSLPSSQILTDERLETLNYESIYSNEYEPIGSEHNSSNLYVDMESSVKVGTNSAGEVKLSKLPPALPPKPANLLKFRKSLQQLDEMPDEHLQQDCGASTTSTALSEPDYCSISEVNMAIKSVQIKVDVHKAPESEADTESQANSEAPVSELEVEVSTVASDDACCAASQKTDEVEEILADIPKLPNVAAIIAPKHAKYQQQKQQDDYLIMSPKVEIPNLKMQNARKLILNNTNAPTTNEFINNTPLKSPKVDNTPLKLQLSATNGGQYKRKHVPNILAEINKRMSLPSSPTTPTTPNTPPKLLTPNGKHSQMSMLNSPNSTLRQHMEDNSPSLPLQAEFDWYNLDAEYGKAPLKHHHPAELLKASDNMNSNNMLAEIHEDHECAVSTADEYNLDEEFSLGSEKAEEVEEQRSTVNETNLVVPAIALKAAISEAVNFPIFSENSPLVPATPATAFNATKTKKMKKNLANFEKFIEGSGMSTKPLPTKRKIYFAGPFV